MNRPPTKGQAFIKGGLGCLLLFAAIALVVVLMGGRARADVGGLILLFVIGGVVGLIVLAIYNRGRRDGGGVLLDEKRDASGRTRPTEPNQRDSLRER